MRNEQVEETPYLSPLSRFVVGPSHFVGRPLRE